MQTRRVQIVGGFIAAIVLPWVLRFAIGFETDDGNLAFNSLAVAAPAILLGYLLYRSVTAYPGIQRSLFVLPTFSIAYGVMILALVLWRIDYSRLMLLFSYGGCLIWFYAIAIDARRQVLKIAIVPFGAIATLQDIDGVDWRTLTAPEMAQIRGCNAVVADLRTDLPDEWERFLSDATLAGAMVLHVKQLSESLTGRVEMDHLSENQFGSLVPVSAYLAIKYTYDFIFALLAAVLLAPFLILVGIAVRLDSKGPALFRQTRIGYAGREFRVLKFRTMIVDASAVDARVQAMTEYNDPRITRLGRFLRRSRIDELPQVINILKGEMSWIGPRPEARVLSEWYERELPFYRYRHIVRPGITGWAQVNQGHVADVDDVLNKLHYDFYYIRHFSPWLDAFIAVRTFVIMITGFGAR